MTIKKECGRSDGVPAKSELSPKYRIALKTAIALFVFLIIIQVVYSGVFPDPTKSQNKVLDHIAYVNTAIAGAIIGLFGGKHF